MGFYWDLVPEISGLSGGLLWSPCWASALPLSAFADRHRLTEITSSSKGSVDTTIEVVYKNAQKKSVKMPIVIAGATSSPDEDRRKAEELAMTLMLASVEAQERFRERGR